MPRTPKGPLLRRSVLRRIRDRKSTRLNSSHSQISYAVFCLKKKKSLEHYQLHCAPPCLLNHLLPRQRSASRSVYPPPQTHRRYASSNPTTPLRTVLRCCDT